MSSTNLTVSALVGAVAASPFTAFFDQDTLLIILFGAAGGSTRWMFLREKFKEGARLAVLGALCAFGFGPLASLVLKPYIGQVPDSVLADPEMKYYFAYGVGLFAVVILGRFIDAKDRKDE